MRATFGVICVLPNDAAAILCKEYSVQIEQEYSPFCCNSILSEKKANSFSGLCCEENGKKENTEVKPADGKDDVYNRFE